MYLRLRIKRGHPDHAAIVPGNLSHILYGGSVHPAYSEIQINAAKNIDPWHSLPCKVGRSGCLHVVIFNHDGTHALRLSKVSKIDCIHRARNTVRTRVSVEVDSVRKRALLR